MPIFVSKNDNATKTKIILKKKLQKKWPVSPFSINAAMFMNKILTSFCLSALKTIDILLKWRDGAGIMASRIKPPPEKPASCEL